MVSGDARPRSLREGGGTAQGLTRDAAPRPRASASGILHISVRAAACDGDPVTGEVPEHAACHLYQQDWGIPVVLQDGAAGRPDPGPARGVRGVRRRPGRPCVNPGRRGTGLGMETS